MKVRKKPVEVEAWMVSDIVELYQLMGQLPNPVANGVIDGYLNIKADHIDVLTLEGVMKASQHDVLIKGVKGEFYPCKADVFNETYEVLQ